MAEEIGFENGRNSNFQGLVTLTLTLDPAIRHTAVHHSSTSTYIPNFIQIEETFSGRTDVRTYGRTDIFPSILLGRLLEVDLKMELLCIALYYCVGKKRDCFVWPGAAHAPIGVRLEPEVNCIQYNNRPLPNFTQIGRDLREWWLKNLFSTHNRGRPCL